MTSEAPKFEQWAIVDVMGHQRYVGLVTEQVIAGTGFVRIDVPETPDVKPWTKLVGTSSIYAITPVSEEIAKAMAAKHGSRPINQYDLPDSMRPRIASATRDGSEDYDDESW